MSLQGPAKQAMIFIEESDLWHGRPLWLAILEKLKSLGCPGVTVLRGLAGYGGHGLVHTATLVELSANLPLVVTFVDRAERFADALSGIAEMVDGGLLVVNDVQVVQCGPRAVFPDQTVQEVMTRAVVSVDGDTTVSDAVALLIDHRLRALPVVEGQRRLVGILTDGDLFERGCLQLPLRFHFELPASEQTGSSLEPLSSPRRVAEVMTPNPQTATPDLPLAEAAALMVKRGLKRLPVVDAQGLLLGMVSRADLLRTVSEGARSLPESRVVVNAGRATVGELGFGIVPTVGPEAPLSELLQKLLETERRRAVVVDSGGHPVGIVTDGDLMRRVGRAVKPKFFQSMLGRLTGARRQGDELELAGAGYFARDVMSSPVVTLMPDAPAEECVRIMMTQRFKQVPVVDNDGLLLGAIGRAEVLRALDDPHAAETSP